LSFRVLVNIASPRTTRREKNESTLLPARITVIEKQKFARPRARARRRATYGRARRDLVDVGIRCDSRSIAMRMPTPAKLVARAMGGKQSKRRERTIAIVCTSADSSACDATRRDDDDD
jgi:hypothetical protein